MERLSNRVGTIAEFNLSRQEEYLTAVSDNDVLREFVPRGVE
jgi:hypothetical protein